MTGKSFLVALVAVLRNGQLLISSNKGDVLVSLLDKIFGRVKGCLDIVVIDQ